MIRSSWFPIAAAAVALVALFFACSPKNPEAVEVVKENLRALNEGDTEALLATIHPESPVYENTVKIASQLSFKSLNFHLDKCDVVSATPNEVRVAFQQTTTHETDEIPDFRGNRVTGSHVLRHDGDQWKIWATTITRVDYLDE